MCTGKPSDPGASKSLPHSHKHPVQVPRVPPGGEFGHRVTKNLTALSRAMPEPPLPLPEPRRGKSGVVGAGAGTCVGTGVRARTGARAHLGAWLAGGQRPGRALPCAGCEVEGLGRGRGRMLAASPVTNPALGTIASRSGWAAVNYGHLPAAPTRLVPPWQKALLGFSPRICLPGAPRGWPALGTSASQGGVQPPQDGTRILCLRPGSPTVTLCGEAQQPRHAAEPSRTCSCSHRSPQEPCSWERAIHPINPSAFPFFTRKMPGKGMDVVIRVT